MSYEEDLVIDEYTLDKEWLTQASKFMSYAEKAAYANKVKKRAKEKMKIIRAEIALSIRQEAKKTNEKLTDKIVESMVQVHPDSVAAGDECILAEYEHEVLDRATDSMEQRKSALESLLKLLIRGYYSTPIPDKDVDDELDSARIELSEKQTTHLNKKRIKKQEDKR